MDHQTVDINAMITGVLSAKHGYFNYYAELETAGKCFVTASAVVPAVGDIAADKMTAAVVIAV